MPTITRRDFFTTIGKTFGVAGLSYVLHRTGLITSDAYARTRFQDSLPPTTGKGKSVAVLGAGVAGLRAAWELAAGGFDVVVLEAAPYMGGRSQTIRPSSGAYRSNWLGHHRGTFPESAYHTQILQEIKDGSGNVVETMVQTCEFKDDDWENGKAMGDPDELYLNAGPGRIASFHNALLDHCRKFDVELEPYTFASRENLMQKDGFNGGEPERLGLLKHSIRQEISKILVTLEDNGKLDDVIGKHDKEAFKEMIHEFGIDEPARRGFITGSPPGAWFNEGRIRPQISLTDILDGDAWHPGLFADMHIHWQTSMMQPAGGMDRIWTNMLVKPLPSEVGGGNIERLISVDCPVRNVECIKGSSGAVKVRIGWSAPDGNGGRVENQRDFDYCISTMGPARLAPLVKNFSNKHLAAYLAAVSNEPACKVGWQSRGRWFEEDYDIFGGISWTSHDISQMWYPSQNFQSRNATLTGLYHFGEVAARFGEKSFEARLELAAEGGAKLHNMPSKGLPVTVEDFKSKLVYFDRGLSIAWQHAPYQDGGWIGLDFELNEQSIDINGERLLLRDQLAGQPFDVLYLAGDWISQTPGWQEGSIRTAMGSVYAIASSCTPGDSANNAGSCRYENLPDAG